MNYGSLYFQLIREKYRSQEIGVDISHHNTQLFPIPFTENFTYIGCLGQVVKGKIRRIVHMPILVDITETDLDRQHMPEFHIICHI